MQIVAIWNINGLVLILYFVVTYLAPPLTTVTMTTDPLRSVSKGGERRGANRVQIYAYLVWVVYNCKVFTASGRVVLSVLTVSE